MIAQAIQPFGFAEVTQSLIEPKCEFIGAGNRSALLGTEPLERIKFGQTFEITS